MRKKILSARCWCVAKITRVAVCGCGVSRVSAVAVGSVARGRGAAPRAARAARRRAGRGVGASARGACFHMWYGKTLGTGTLFMLTVSPDGFALFVARRRPRRGTPPPSGFGTARGPPHRPPLSARTARPHPHTYPQPHPHPYPHRHPQSGNGLATAWPRKVVTGCAPP